MAPFRERQQTNRGFRSEVSDVKRGGYVGPWLCCVVGDFRLGSEEDYDQKRVNGDGKGP